MQFMKNSLLFVVLLFIVNTLSSNAQVIENNTNKKSENINPKFNVLIKGQVIDSLTNETIPYATINITRADNPTKPIKMLASNESGKFETILNIPGNYLLAINSTGKKMLVKPFTIAPADKEINLEKLPVSDSQVLGEVVVTAYKPLVKVDLDKITYSIQDDPDSKTNNVLEMLRKVPMVTIDAQDKIELKGSSSFKIHLDGKPSNLITNNPAQVLRSMPANMIKNIEVITDPGAKYDAEGVTGIINIITYKQPMGGYTANFSGGVNALGGYDGGAYLSMKYGKLGFTGNYNYSHFRNPESNYDTYRENYTNDQHRYLFQDGKNKYEGDFQYGYGELSYEIDTLNLISANFNLMGGKGTSKMNLDVSEQDINKNNVYSYKQSTEGDNTFGGSGFNLDYQRTFKKKDELLTASYRLGLSPNDNNSETKIDEAVNFPESWQISKNNASDKEHAFQLDYTTPLAKIHTIEGGAKYIIRLNESEGDRSRYDYTTEEWKPIITDNDQFKYRYDILAAYLGYNLRFKDYGFKAGLRMEDTKIEADYPLNTDKNFDTEYFTLVPSGTITYRYKMVHSFRLGYNMRVQRPGIWYLNPYSSSTDPKYISRGNPDLDVEKGHNISLNYSVFKPKINMNVSLNYGFMNNSIQQVTEVIEDVSYTTYKNIGKNNQTSLNVYFNGNLTKQFRFYVNGTLAYMDIRANNGSGLKNHGFYENITANLQYSLPHNFRIMLNGGIASPRVNLQGESSGYHYSALGLTKSMLNNKLNFSLSVSSPFEKYRDYYSERYTSDEFYRMNSQYVARNISFRVSYRFGEMKQQIKKAQRGINNDDTKASESSNSGSSGGSGGGSGQ